MFLKNSFDFSNSISEYPRHLIMRDRISSWLDTPAPTRHFSRVWTGVDFGLKLPLHDPLLGIFSFSEKSLARKFNAKPLYVLNSHVLYDTHTHTQIPVYFPLGIGYIPDYPPTRPFHFSVIPSASNLESGMFWGCKFALKLSLSFLPDFLNVEVSKKLWILSGYLRDRIQYPPQCIHKSS